VIPQSQADIREPAEDKEQPLFVSYAMEPLLRENCRGFINRKDADCWSPITCGFCAAGKRFSGLSTCLLSITTSRISLIGQSLMRMASVSCELTACLPLMGHLRRIFSLHWAPSRRIIKAAQDQFRGWFISNLLLQES